MNKSKKATSEPPQLQLCFCKTHIIHDCAFSKGQRISNKLGLDQNKKHLLKKRNSNFSKILNAKKLHELNMIA